MHVRIHHGKMSVGVCREYASPYVCTVLLASLGSIPGTEPLRHDKASTEEGNTLQCFVCMVTYMCIWHG